VVVDQFPSHRRKTSNRKNASIRVECAAATFTPKSIRIAAARTNLEAFARVMHQDVFNARLDVAPFHGRLFAFLLGIFEGNVTRAIITLPPLSGKTTLVLLFLAWAQGRAADAATIIVSYGSDLAERSSALLKQIIEHPRYQQIFPHVTLSRETSARDRWTTTVGAELRAVGVGGALTGFGAGRLRDDHRWGGGRGSNGPPSRWCSTPSTGCRSTRR
jgi:hypothetical protein